MRAKRPALSYFEQARDAETADHAARLAADLAAEDAKSHPQKQRRRWLQPWVRRYTKGKYTSDIATRDPVEETLDGHAVTDRDDERVGALGISDPQRSYWIGYGYGIASERYRVYVAAKSRIMPGDKEDRALNLIMEVFNPPWDGEGEEPIMQPVPAAYFKDAAEKAVPPISWQTVRRRAFEHLGVKSTPIPGMSAGKMWTLPADHGPNRAPEGDVWPDGKGGWTTTPPLDDGAE